MHFLLLEFLLGHPAFRFVKSNDYTPEVILSSKSYHPLAGTIGDKRFIRQERVNGHNDRSITADKENFNSLHKTFNKQVADWVTENIVEATKELLKSKKR